MRASKLLMMVCFGLIGSLVMGCGKSSDESAADKSGKATPALDAKSLVARATTELQQRNWQTALRTLTEAIKLDAKCADAYFHRASVLADVGQAPAALIDFNKAIELSPKDAKFRHTRGYFLMTQQQIDAAIADFTAAVACNEKYAQSYNNRGLARLAKGEREKALADFEQALRIDPKYVEALINRGFAMYQAGQPKRAIADYDQALKLNPDNVHALNNRGLAHFELKDYDAAVADYTQAIDRDPYNAKFHGSRRECYLKLNLEAEAQADAAKVAWLGKLNELNRTVAHQPKAADKYVQLAEHLIAGGEHKVGLASFETAAKVQPDYAKTYSSRAAYWFAQGDFEKAIADCDRALKIEPHFEAHKIRGDAHFQMRDYDSAIFDYQKAKLLDAQVARAFLLRSKQLAAAGREAEAEADRQKAIEINASLQE